MANTNTTPAICGACGWQGDAPLLDGDVSSDCPACGAVALRSPTMRESAAASGLMDPVTGKCEGCGAYTWVDHTTELCLGCLNRYRHGGTPLPTRPTDGLSAQGQEWLRARIGRLADRRPAPVERISDMRLDHAWPRELQAAHHAASLAEDTYRAADDCEDMARKHSDADLPECRQFAADAYRLWMAAETRGARLLAQHQQHEAERWEAEQARRAVLGTGAPEHTGAIYACADCGDGTYAGPDAETPFDGADVACPNCGRISGVYKVAGGIPVKEPEQAPAEPEYVYYFCHNCYWAKRAPMPEGGPDAPLPACPACDKSAVEMQPASAPF